MSRRTTGAFLVLALLTSSIVLLGVRGSMRDAQRNPSRVSDLTEVDPYQIHGYPLDRSLAQLVQAPDLDAILVVDDVEIGAAVELTSPNWSGFTAMVTTARGRVDDVLLGPVLPESSIAVIFPGGAREGVRVHASAEIAPPLDRVVSRRLLLAGSLVQHRGLGEVLEPAFVYEITRSGRARSLIESGGAQRFPAFDLQDLRRRLDERGTYGRLRGTAR